MGGHPVSTAGSVSCSHGGSATLASTAKLTVAGKPVLPFATMATLTPYTGCTFPQGQPPTPCTVTTVVSGGSAAKLTVGSQPVLLDDVQAQAGTPAPPTAASVAAGQTTVTAS